MARHVRKGDEVIILSGDYRGRTGTIREVITKKDRVVVAGPGIDAVRKNMRPTRENPQGGITEIDRTFHLSNVAPVVDGKPTRVRFEVGKDGSKKRVAVRNGAVLGEVRSAKAKK
ncbi:MAG: 50S ribosomal protein L24 [Planctomycetota bacterium]